MSYLDKNINRRGFLRDSAAMTAACLLGFNSFSKALALEVSNKKQTAGIAIIIDDIGYSISRARQFLDLGVPITFSILPRLTNSINLSLEIKKNGHEIMLHQPMEPYNSAIDPGPGALYAGDGKERIMRVMEENISEIPFASGINNHMGSKFTALPDKMYHALGAVKERNMFFVDSLTSNHSKGFATAKYLKMAAAHRNLFLDNVVEESAILNQLLKLKIHAINHGMAVGIGHPFPETASAIKTFCGSQAGQSVSLVHISEVIKS
ncbi:MAG: divergent polysaccharide deacetylase family protein [Desulfobacteraceae bacterium]|nr:MAG: divergent polysaccharide deacetylase family protein [Desulfobacteraceae bacterium]